MTCHDKVLSLIVSCSSFDGITTVSVLFRLSQQTKIFFNHSKQSSLLLLPFSCLLVAFLPVNALLLTATARHPPVALKNITISQTYQFCWLLLQLSTHCIKFT